MNAFCGILEEKGYEFCRIDYFKDFEGGKAFFLTHFHRDHMNGLSSPAFHELFKEKEDVYFYCSKITKRFIERDPDINIPSNKIYTLEKDEEVYICNGDVCVKVTALRAGHCPGSLMLLFESSDGHVLFTGDFRLSLEDVKKVKALHRNEQVIKLNHIYLDTTFADSFYASFPNRETSFEIIKDIIIRCKMNGFTYTVIDPPAGVGIEYLMVELNKYFNKPIYVSDYSYQRFHSLIEPLEKIVTTDISSTDIHFCTFKGEKCDACPENIKKYKVVKLKPSALYFETDTCERNQYYVQPKEYFYRVAYSSHCSLNELNDFVTYLKPDKITPLVVRNASKEMIINMVQNWRKSDE